MIDRCIAQTTKHGVSGFGERFKTVYASIHGKQFLGTKPKMRTDKKTRKYGTHSLLLALLLPLMVPREPTLFILPRRSSLVSSLPLLSYEPLLPDGLLGCKLLTNPLDVAGGESGIKPSTSSNVASEVTSARRCASAATRSCSLL